MKKHIQVSRNEANPQIPPRPDFNALAKNAAGMVKPFWKQTWFYGTAGTALIGLTALLLWMNQGTNTTPKISSQKQPVEISAIKPPVKAWDVPCDTFEVNVANGDTLVYKGCTKIIIPAGGIVKNDGGKIQKTKVVYREFQNQADVMLSGIPMLYDSAGKKMLFESAGMFELKSVAKDEEINSATNIQIKMCSKTAKGHYNWYKLDEKSGAWTYIKPSTFSGQSQQKQLDSTATENPSVDVIKGNLAIHVTINPNDWDNAKSVALPPKPRLKSAKGYTYTVEEPNVPELAIYKNLVFEVLPNQGFDPKKLPDVWDGITVTRTAKYGEYLLTLKDSKRTLKFLSIPVFLNATDYNAAMEVFMKQEDKYFNYLQDKLDSTASKNNAENQARQNLITQTGNNLNYGTMVAAFSFNKFGYYNSDRPIQNTQQTITINYNIQGGGKGQGHLYQYFLNRNAVMVNYDFSPGQTTLRFSKKDNCVLLAILPQDKTVAYITPEEYRKEIVENRNGNIELQKADVSFDNADDIQKWVMKEFKKPKLEKQ